MEKYLEKVGRPEDLSVAIEAAEAAGKVMNKYQKRVGELSTKEKTGHNDIVTEADLEAQKAVINVIKQEFPDDGLKGEEENLDVEDYSRRTWVVDPIDGTSNFERGLEYFCTSIGLRVDGEYVMGVVYSPETALDQTFFACKGSGAYKVENGSIEEINVSEREVLKSGVVLGSISSRNKEGRKKDIEIVNQVMNRGSKFRRLGSAALQFCKVASGRGEAVMYRELNEWDLAASKVIVEEAGGCFEEERIPESEKFSVLATNDEVHDMCSRIFEGYRS